MSHTFLPSADPFGRTTTLAFEASVPILGVPVRIRSNAEAVLDLTEAAFGAWRGLPDALIDAAARADLEIIVRPATDEPLPARLTYRRHGDVLLAAGDPV